MPALTSIAVGGLAAAGAVSGAMGKSSSQSQKSWVDAGHATASEQAGHQAMLNSFNQLQGMVNAGPGQQDVSNAYANSQSLAAMLGQYSQTGGLPSDSDIGASNDIASKLFGVQRTQLAQNFEDQLTGANRQAALMGRDPNDPILRNKLAQEQTRQTALLDSQQGAFAQQFALNQPMQRLGFAQQQNQLLGGLATQAMQNRQAIASMGAGIMDSERQFRLQTATRYGNQTTESGGGLGGAISGALGGAATGFGIAGALGGAPSFGGASGGFNMAPAASNMGGYFSGPNPFAQSALGASQFGGVPQAPSLGVRDPFNNQAFGAGGAFSLMPSY